MKADHQQQIRNAKVPGWFKCRLFEASEGRTSTGSRAMRAGYYDAGEALAENLYRVLDREQIDQIKRHSADLERWTCENLKQFYALIPARKRRPFLEGFRRGLVRGGHLNPTLDVIREEFPPAPKIYLTIDRAEERPQAPKYLIVESLVPEGRD